MGKNQRRWKRFIGIESMTLCLLGVMASLFMQFHVDVPVRSALLSIYWHWVVVMALMCGMFFWVRTRYIEGCLRVRSGAAFKPWRTLLITGCLVILACLALAYWVVLQRFLPVFPETGAHAVLAHGIYWVMTALALLIVLYTVWLLFSRRLVLLEVLQHSRGDKDENSQRH